jgi:EAL domain-containing protein (putative c-di-GMP-specific phosphodiesterase class I)
MLKRAPRAGVRRALNQKQLVLFYQPIHETESRKIVSAEALLRSRRPGGEIRSGVPLTITAEEGPDLFRLDSWTMKRALRDAATWQHKGIRDVRINVNLSAREFQEGDVSKRLKKLVTGYGAATDQINVEITETSYIDQPKRTSRAVDELRELGVQLWLDDFGTGYSSISHLLHFELDGVKLPGTFIKDLPGSRRCRSITKAIIDLAHDLDMQVIAEGIEHRDQLAFLRDCRCEFIQGFLFSKPMPIDKFVDLLTQSSAASPPRGNRRRAAPRGRASRSS